MIGQLQYNPGDTDLDVVSDSHAVDFDVPVAEEQDVAVDTTQIDESLSYNETTICFSSSTSSRNYHAYTQGDRLTNFVSNIKRIYAN